jgi:hypothetical protein
MRYLLPILGAALVLFVSCTTTPTSAPGEPTVQAVPLSGGDTLVLTWTAVTNATGYYVYIDGAVADTLTGLSIDIGTPAKQIDVTAYNSGGESSKWSLSTAPITTTSLTAYAMSDSTSTMNSFGFNASSGVCSVLDDTVSANAASIDYLFEDRNSVPLSFYSPNEYTPAYNSKVNGSAELTDAFDAVLADPGPGNYSTKTAITVNKTYALWLGSSTSWSASDHFAKIEIETATSGGAITFRTAYQTVAGLRWLVTQ